MTERITWGKDPNEEPENPDEYKKKKEPTYCDKGGHKERSKANDDRKKGHNDHWKKDGKK